MISEDCKYRLTLSLFITVTSTRVSRGPETVSHRIPLLTKVEKKIKACKKTPSNSSPPLPPQKPQDPPCQDQILETGLKIKLNLVSRVGQGRQRPGNQVSTSYTRLFATLSQDFSSLWPPGAVVIRAQLRHENLVMGNSFGFGFGWINH